MSDPQHPEHDPARSPYGHEPRLPGEPGEHAPATGYPQPSYDAAAGYPYAGYGAAPTPTSTLGRTAFIIAVITAAIGLFFVLANPFLIPSMRDGYAVYQLVSFGRSILGLALGALALILGIVAARRRAQPVLAGIAIGVGAVEVVGVLASFFVTLIYTVI